MDLEKLHEIVNNLVKYIRKEEYKGYDPYDVLNSPLFNLPILKNNKTIRFLSQQVFRRIPFNLRPLLGIKKEINPVSLGLCIQAYTYLCMIKKDERDFYENEIKKLIDLLIDLRSKGYSGYCWGYNFDWEARYARINKFVPTVVATGIITNGLFEYYKYSKDDLVREIILSSTKFVLNDLNRSYEGDTFCFSYSPNDNQKVYNATMKGARLLAQGYYLAKDKNLIIEGERTVRFVTNNQNNDGSWYYSKGDARKWVDNFHTAYVLDSLKSFIELSGKDEYRDWLNRGLDYYLNNLFTKEGIPKYYSNSLYPIDSTELAQSIITLIDYGKILEVEKIFQFCIINLYSSKGYFYNRRYKYYLDKNIFIRWSIAWLLLAFSKLLHKRLELKYVLV